MHYEDRCKTLSSKNVKDLQVRVIVQKMLTVRNAYNLNRCPRAWSMRLGRLHDEELTRATVREYDITLIGEWTAYV